jgi:hypothetical protein
VIYINKARTSMNPATEQHASTSNMSIGILVVLSNYSVAFAGADFGARLLVRQPRTFSALKKSTIRNLGL